MQPEYKGKLPYLTRPEIVKKIGTLVSSEGKPGLPNSLSRNQLIRVFAKLGGKVDIALAEMELPTLREAIYKMLGETCQDYTADFSRTTILVILDRLENLK